MLLMAQCATFQSWASMSTMSSWRDAGYMKRPCDLVETQDLLDWQQFTNLIATYGPSSYRLPNITGTGVPLSTILVAHHNLVTYGVPWDWIRPKTRSLSLSEFGPVPAPPAPTPSPEYVSKRRYYAPATAVQQLVNTKLFSGDADVQKWHAKVGDLIEPAAIESVPGMSAWVTIAKKCWTEKPLINKVPNGAGTCTGGQWRKMFKDLIKEKAMARAAR